MRNSLPIRGHLRGHEKSLGSEGALTARRSLSALLPEMPRIPFAKYRADSHSYAFNGSVLVASIFFRVQNNPELSAWRFLAFHFLPSPHRHRRKCLICCGNLRRRRPRAARFSSQSPSFARQPVFTSLFHSQWLIFSLLEFCSVCPSFALLLPSPLISWQTHRCQARDPFRAALW